MDFATMMTLEPHGPDTYIGIGPAYPWGGLYGGQIVAQALRAAADTVDAAFQPHSLHAYFIRRGDSSEPIRFEVDRVRNGRTFVTRSVTVRQSVGALLHMGVSFQSAEDQATPAVQTEHFPDVPAPDALVDGDWTPVFHRRAVDCSGEAGRGSAWFRMAAPLGSDPILSACALAYESDDLPSVAVIAQHPERPGLDTAYQTLWSASLDHAIWFHLPFDADEWLLHDFTCHGLLGSRGLSVGKCFTTAGTHVATITQEVLLRPAKA